jgi:hypothetical protein
LLLPLLEEQLQFSFLQPWLINYLYFKGLKRLYGDILESCLYLVMNSCCFLFAKECANVMVFA